MLLDVLRATAAAQPGHPAVITPAATTSYAALVVRAEATARGLRARGIRRFGIAANDPLDVITLLAAASATGAEACAYPRDLDAAGARPFAERLGHGVVVADAPMDLPGVEVLTPAGLPRDGPDGPTPGATPVLVLTTGSTGTPKGVRHDWARLIGAVHRARRAPDDRWLLAYNLNQFAGYQVLLHALVNGSTLVLPRSSHARDVVEAMREHAITHASATPTFWRLLVGAQDEAPGALALRQITLGGEPTPDSLIERLRGAFPEARISHVYAGTEFGSAVAVTDGRAGLPVSVLERSADAGAQFRVVDGELQVRSRGAMLGYHDAAGEDADVWHATGDLVEERDGRLHFVGRTVEIINVGGAKVHPLPIEELVSRVPGVVAATVRGAPNAITGQIVAVDVVPAPDADPDEVKAAIQAACAGLPAPGRPRRITFVAALEVLGHKAVRRPTGAAAS